MYSSHLYSNLRNQGRNHGQAFKGMSLTSHSLPLKLANWGESESRSVISNSLQPHGLYSPWKSPGQNTGVGSLPLLQGIFPTQGSNPSLPHCRQILCQLSHNGSPGMLKWVAYSLLQRIFQTQESNWGLLHCRRILYQLSYQKSPNWGWGGQ